MWPMRKRRPDKGTAVRTTCRGRKFDVLIGNIDNLEATPEFIRIDGYEVTDADLDRGWIDPNDLPSEEAG